MPTLTYKLLKNTTLTLTASQSVAPSIVGSLFKTDIVAAGISHTINDRSTISFSATGNALDLDDHDRFCVSVSDLWLQSYSGVERPAHLSISASVCQQRRRFHD